MKFAFLSQHLDELRELGDLRVRDVLSRYKTRYEFDGRELTPAQLLERLGFEAAQLSAVVSDLSGGQKRRLQLMLILLERPNVLILDEPDNDLDTDMLAVMESLLDSWPGTLLLISHDRYLMERITDDQFALLDGRVRHVPGGVDEYLRLLDTRSEAAAAAQTARRKSKESTAPTSNQAPDARGSALLSNVQERALKKELAATERKIEALAKKAEVIRLELGCADPTDYVALVDAQARLHDVELQISVLEDEWMALSERLS